MNIIKQMGVIGKCKEAAGSSMDSHDSVAHSSYCSPMWPALTLENLISAPLTVCHAVQFGAGDRLVYKYSV